MLLSLLLSTCDGIEEFTLLTAESVVHSTVLRARESDLIFPNRKVNSSQYGTNCLNHIPF